MAIQLKLTNYVPKISAKILPDIKKSYVLVDPRHNETKIKKEYNQRTGAINGWKSTLVE